MQHIATCGVATSLRTAQQQYMVLCVGTDLLWHPCKNPFVLGNSMTQPRRLHLHLACISANMICPACRSSEGGRRDRDSTWRRNHAEALPAGLRQVAAGPVPLRALHPGVICRRRPARCTAECVRTAPPPTRHVPAAVRPLLSEQSSSAAKQAHRPQSVIQMSLHCTELGV